MTEQNSGGASVDAETGHIARYTYADLIRKYSDDVAAGHADTDLNPRERRLVRVMLNVASNAGHAAVIYPPTDDTRERTVRHLSDVLWNGARAIAEAVSPASSDAISAAIERTVTILRGI